MHLLFQTKVKYIAFIHFFKGIKEESIPFMKQIFQYGSWLVEYTPEDGARLNRLCFDGYDLLTTEPKSFRPPSTDYGEYENRPVYGYDDCFPSVEPCIFPGTDLRIPDHGELCWLSWEASRTTTNLIFTVKSKILPVQFSRKMLFSNTSINWMFEVLNESDGILHFQHVIHPLIPLNEVVDFNLPPFQSIYNETTQQMMDLKDPKAVKDFLLKMPVGTTNMLFLQRVQTGKMSMRFRNGIRLEMIFPVESFLTIGIWWNNSAYPDEKGCQRNECAFEPIPGLTSVLTQAYQEKYSLSVDPKKKYSWQIQWNIYQ